MRFERITKFCFILFFLIFGCDKKGTGPGDPGMDYTDFIGFYLGKETPGTIPIRFASDVLLATDSWWWHDCPVFSPNGRELFFSQYINSNSPVSRIEYMVMDDNNRWIYPQPVSFTSTYGDDSPRFSTDGRKIFFTSQRPGGGIFVVNRNGNGDDWGDPEGLDFPDQESLHIVGISIAQDETIYFGTSYSGYNDIYCTRLINGAYAQPENLGPSINTAAEEWGPYVDPDEEFIIFASNRPGGFGLHDLYISFQDNGNWSEAQNMGDLINSDNEDASPNISPDGLYLFFNTQRAGDLGYNPYWVDAQIIECFRPAD